MGTFTLFKGSSDGRYYFNLKASNGEIILQSQGYIYKSSAEAGISSVKSNSQIDSRYSQQKSITGDHYFILKAANGETIGRSQMYSSSQAMEVGIASVKTNAPGAHTNDLT